jgi:hypothetical protein
LSSSVHILSIKALDRGTLMAYNIIEYEWDEYKNIEVIEKGRPSFETITFKIGTGFLLDVVMNPSKKYPNQKMFIVQVDGKIWVVPFEKRKARYRLITVFFSQMFHNMYRGKCK